MRQFWDIDANSVSKSWVSNLENCFLKEFKYNLAPSVWKILVSEWVSEWKLYLPTVILSNTFT